MLSGYDNTRWHDDHRRTGHTHRRGPRTALSGEGRVKCCLWQQKRSRAWCYSCCISKRAAQTAQTLLACTARPKSTSAGLLTSTAAAFITLLALALFVLLHATGPRSDVYLFSLRSYAFACGVFLVGLYVIMHRQNSLLHQLWYDTILQQQGIIQIQQYDVNTLQIHASTQLRIYTYGVERLLVALLGGKGYSVYLPTHYCLLPFAACRMAYLSCC